MDSASIDVSGDGKVTKVITKEGTGDCPTTGKKVKVHYTGKLTNGEKFDSSRDRNKVFQFDLGKGQVIKGWDLGIATMKKGECCTLTIDPTYGYGSRDMGPIPKNSTLIFECELVDF
mmetsp:Transcript_37230/g.43459  ORF Transcript_37230/g.43459 Transcript_37230/m.43459 type:complete len:117 (-) Transcript_37230:196-546(-)